MQRYTLSLNGIPYLIEHIKSDELEMKHVSQFVMLRNYDIDNDIAIDKDIFFIPLNEYKELITYDKESGEYYQDYRIAYPYTNKEFESYSESIFDFLPDASFRTLTYLDKPDGDKKKDYYELYKKDEDGNFAKCEIECDIIRIYRPHHRKQLDSIIAISNRINDIRFHYFCERYNAQDIHIGKEVKEGNNKYYEYIEFFIPNIESLFGSNNVYFNEDLNFYQKMYFNNKTFKSTYELMNVDDNDEEQKLLLQTLILPYSIDKGCTLTTPCDLCENRLTLDGKECPLKNLKNVNIKTFIVKDTSDIEYANSDYNYSNVPFVLTLSHYDNIDEETSHYFSLSGISPSSIVFSQNNQFYISSKIEFDKHNQSIISVVNRWKYPHINNLNGQELSIRDAYFYFNKITNINEYFEFNGYDEETFLDDFTEEFVSHLTFKNCGCLIEMALDIRFKDVFYRTCASMDDGIDDFAFNINHIFTTWQEYPEVIFVRTMFIDKFLSKIFFSNTMVLTKEKFKYCINSTENYRVRFNSRDMKTYNFIDKINCSITKHDIAQENVKLVGGSAHQKIVYKTIFYKTYETQNVKIRQGVVQNVGINLGDYLTKVENFKIKIEDYEFVESARNDAYVIFKIPGVYITNALGYYDVLNADDDTYITTGKYQLI